MLFQLVSLGIDAAIFGILSKALHSRSSNLENLKNAPTFAIDGSLAKTVEKFPNSQVPYAIVTGAVKANGKTLNSFNSSSQGVIQEFVIKEYKTEWKSWTRFWIDVEKEIVRQTNTVPFSLESKSHFKVEVVDPKSALDLPVSNIFNRFTPTETGLTSLLVNFFKGEHSRGIQEIENMLVEGTILTGIGKLTLENGSVSLRPPTNNLYHLTTLSPQEVVENLQQEVKDLQFYRIIFGCVGLGFAAWVLYLWLKQRREKKEKQRMLDKVIKNRIQRKLNERSAPTDQENSPPTQLTCAVCYLNPIEITVVPCGHACLCCSCTEKISKNCPMCREEIQSLLPVFFP